MILWRFVMKKRNFSALIIAVIMAFSAVSIGDLAFTQSSIVAYAASLSAPSVKASAASYKSVKLSWKKVKRAKKYIIMRSAKKKSGYKTIKTTTKTSYTDSKTSCGKTYYYKVIAVNGKTKKTSKVIKIKCTPAKVTSVKASSKSCGKITISFKSVKGASGYSIAYSSTKNGKYKTLANVKSAAYTHSVGVGNKGYYKVRAYRTVKGKKVYGAYSSVKSATAAVHRYASWETVSASNCVIAGVQSSTCSVCGDTIYTSLGLSGHNYTATVVAPTCTSGGYTVYACTVCGSSYTDNYTPASGHDYGSYKVEKRATCSEAGTKYTECSRCGDRQYAAIEATGSHQYTVTSTATCTADGEIIKTCSVCGRVETSPTPATGHNYVDTVIEPTTTKEGYTIHACTNCPDMYIDSYTPILIHTSSKQYTVKSVTLEDGTVETHLYDTCAECSEEFETDTFSLDLTDIKNKDLSAYAGIAELSASGNKLTLTATKYIDNFVLYGNVSDITISVDAFDDADIILGGVTITNSDTTIIDDCIRINDKCTDTEQVVDDLGNTVTEKIVPTVSVTAQNGTVNTLTVTATGGNAVQCETKLEFKGHGTLNMNTVSTAVDARAKVDIKNILMNIESDNRGIDTKIETKNEAGLVLDTDYANIDFGANAVIIIHSYDDGIRCKNMEFEALGTSAGDTDSQLTIVSEIGDAMQLEGKKGLTMYQGTVNLTGGKSALNNKSGIVPSVNGSAQLIMN